MAYWRIEDVIVNAFFFCVGGLISGYLINALGMAVEQIPGVPFPLVYLIFFIVIPAFGYFSDFEEMVIRGLIFSLSVGFFSTYLGDPIEAITALTAFMVGLSISYFRTSRF